MNTLIFLGGMGIGAFISASVIVLMIGYMSRSMSNDKKAHVAHNEATLAALLDRNNLTRQTNEILKHIANRK